MLSFSPELVELAVQLLREHSELPELGSVNVTEFGTGRISLHLSVGHESQLHAVALWAQALRTDVVLSWQSGTDVKVTATAQVLAADLAQPARVEVWAYLDLPEVLTAVTVLGIAPGAGTGPVHIGPARVLQLLGAAPAGDLAVAR
ncbi:hypothetical protein FKR81_16695 [Lentzea tibetensis]|uniref:Uncharacterized protein n=1 Tax=Lentzea tibetensis TaxID=2591470 RepID=A0A563EUA5_9PSEU|nr:hypothetical protein [Lentzea tibetensis]TWP51250.1 hypothetical protein FKR81_16695 [Lentzea tibetensis]